MLIKGCVQLGHAPTMSEKITILPVDFVSKATVKISLAERNRSAVYHIDHPTGIMWSDLITWLNDYGYTIKFTSMKEWKKMLTTISHDNALYPFLPYYLAMPDEVKAVNVDTQKAAAMLKALHIDYPEINDQLLTIYFDYLAGVGFLPASKREEKRKFLGNVGLPGVFLAATKKKQKKGGGPKKKHAGMTQFDECSRKCG